ncbi:hypothetical protein [Nocardioides sp.]|uniref:hypothetical protein n=1 Tax=Nocardioides sp. TaxID=35761 RepID=UPI00260EA0FB|nr:hypothetical protein [Nocardioides sp.]
MRPRWVSSAVLALAVTLLWFFAIAGSSRFSGPVLWEFGSSSHGVHRDDLLVTAVWLGCLWYCLSTARRR